jgi:hypothetical protein
MEFPRLHPLNISGFSNELKYSAGTVYGTVTVDPYGAMVVDSEYTLANVNPNFLMHSNSRLNRYRSPGIYVMERDTTEENVVEVMDDDDALIMRMTVGQLRMFINVEITRLLGH